MALFFSGKKKKLKESELKLRRVREDLADVSEYLGDFLSFLPLPVCDVSPSGMILNVNKTFERFSSFAPVELIGERLSKFFLSKSDIDRLLSQAGEKGIIVNQQLSFIPKDKKRRFVDTFFASRADKEGNLTGYFVGIIDITALRELQQGMEAKIETRTRDLEESRRALLNILEDTEISRSRAEEERIKTETILTNFVDGLLVFNSDRELELINPQAERFLRVRKESIVGKSMEELSRNPKTAILVKILDHKLKEVFREELSLSEDLTLEVTTTFVVLRKEKTAFLITLHNVTREKVIERMKSQFVSIAAHQLRTPLSIIKWALGMFLGGDVGKITKDQRGLLKNTYQTNERMIKLINDLLNVARIEEGRYIYQPKIVEFDELLKKVFNSLKEMAQKRKLSFVLVLKKSTKPMVVKVDVEKMTLAIKNLMDNAITYTNPGGKIKIALKRKKNSLEFSIEDNGVGIPAKQQHRVFSKFFRGSNVIKMETDGTGLGLFITRNIIEAHRGKIWFKSKENQGTTIYFTLPVVI